MSGPQDLAANGAPKGSLVRIFGWTQASCSRSFAHWKLLGRLLEIQRRPEHSWLPDQKEGLVSKVFSPSLGPCRWRTLIAALEVKVQDLGPKCTQCEMKLLCPSNWRGKMQSMRTATRAYLHYTARCPGFQLESTKQRWECTEKPWSCEEYWSQIWRRDTPALTVRFSLMARSPWKSLPSLWIVRSSSSSSDDEWRVEWNWSCSAAFRGYGSCQTWKACCSFEVTML